MEANVDWITQVGPYIGLIGGLVGILGGLGGGIISAISFRRSGREHEITMSRAEKEEEEAKIFERMFEMEKSAFESLQAIQRKRGTDPTDIKVPEPTDRIGQIALVRLFQQNKIVVQNGEFWWPTP